MRAFIFIFRTALVIVLLSTALVARAADSAAPQAADQGGSKTDKPEEEDLNSNPYTDYGDFQSEEDETADTTFFQYGRFFGLNLGIGMESVGGNRGQLWGGGFPLIDIRTMVWFDFNFAIDLEYYSVGHSFSAQQSVVPGAPAQQINVAINMSRLGVDLRYYFDTKNVVAPIAFANPFVTLGGGVYYKTETPQNGPVASDSSFAVCGGAGLEFSIVPKKTVFNFEARVHLPTFKDTNLPSVYNNLPDLTGPFFTFVGSVMFTW